MAVTPKIKLRVSVNDFVFEVRKLALAVTNHAARLSRATDGKINARTARRMTLLVDQLVGIEISRVPIVSPSSRSAVREAEKLIASIGIAGRYVAQTDPVTREHLDRVQRLNKKSRAAAAVKFALEMHLAFALETRVASLMPGVEREAAQLIERLASHVDAVKLVSDRRAAVAEERKAIVDELKQLSSEVRAIVKVLGRVDPELARELTRT